MNNFVFEEDMKTGKYPELEQAQTDAHNAFRQWRDLQDYASRELKRVFYVDKETGFYTNFQPVYMFGMGYTDAELGAYCYEAKLEYERLQEYQNKLWANCQRKSYGLLPE